MNTKLPQKFEKKIDWETNYKKLVALTDHQRRQLARTEMLLREERRKTSQLETENHYLKRILRRNVE